MSDLEKTGNIKENVYLIELKNSITRLNKVVIILENFQPSFLNFAGLSKKLNGSQVF